MPYIAQRRRDLFDSALGELRRRIRSVSGEGFTFGPGDLAYLVYVLLLETAGRPPKSFADANAMIGAVRQAVREYETVVLVPYENGKRRDNGDIS